MHSCPCLICSSVEDDSPRFSPDGRKIVFVSKRTGTDEIWMADNDGRYPVRLTSIGGSPAGSPRWSADGNWIAFDSRVSGSPDIFVISAQGGKARQFTFEPSVDVAPSWSHDGRWIYFASDRGGHGTHIWKMPFQGSDARQVTQDTGAECLESPDGARLFYFRGGRQGFWTVPVDGGRETVVPELATIRPTRAWTVRPEGIYFYEDGPDSSHLVRFFDFVTHKVITLLSSAVGPLRARPGIDVSPDGSRLLYTQTDERHEGLLMIENFR